MRNEMRETERPRSDRIDGTVGCKTNEGTGDADEGMGDADGGQDGRDAGA
jgi:hypothetical protein